MGKTRVVGGAGDVGIADPGREALVDAVDHEEARRSGAKALALDTGFEAIQAEQEPVVEEGEVETILLGGTDRRWQRVAVVVHPRAGGRKVLRVIVEHAQTNPPGQAQDLLRPVKHRTPALDFAPDAKRRGVGKIEVLEVVVYLVADGRAREHERAADVGIGLAGGQGDRGVDLHVIGVAGAEELVAGVADEALALVDELEAQPVVPGELLDGGVDGVEVARLAVGRIQHLVAHLVIEAHRGAAAGFDGDRRVETALVVEGGPLFVFRLVIEADQAQAEAVGDQGKVDVEHRAGGTLGAVGEDGLALGFAEVGVHHGGVDDASGTASAEVDGVGAAADRDGTGVAAVERNGSREANQCGAAEAQELRSIQVVHGS